LSLPGTSPVISQSTQTSGLSAANSRLTGAVDVGASGICAAMNLRNDPQFGVEQKRLAKGGKARRAELKNASNI